MADDELEHCVVQIALAKQLALAGAADAANLLATTSLTTSHDTAFDVGTLEVPVHTETLRSVEPVPAGTTGDTRTRRSQVVQLTVRSEGLASALRQAKTVHAAVSRVRDISRRRAWKRTASVEGAASLITPHGLALSLHVKTS